MRDMSPRELARNDLIEEAYHWDETLKQERSERLKVQRPARARKPSAHQKIATQKRTDRLDAVVREFTKLRPTIQDGSALMAASRLKRLTIFQDVELDTLRKDIARIKKELARHRQ